jgi:hypothetical protein
VLKSCSLLLPAVDISNAVEHSFKEIVIGVLRTIYQAEMPSNQISEISRDFSSRLDEIATAFGSRSALARAANIPAASLQSYASGSEPTRPVLVALARAANVSVDWLATGEGPKSIDAPEGYVRVGIYDLAATGSHIRGIMGGPTGSRLFYQRDLIGVAGVSIASTMSFAIEQFEASEPLSFEPEIHAGDVLLITMPPGHLPTRPSEVRSWNFVKEQAIYLVADGIALKLRRLRRSGKQKDSVTMIDPEGKPDGKPLTGVPRDFILWGPVIWRGGKL